MGVRFELARKVSGNVERTATIGATCALYDVLAMVRGPDEDDQYVAKEQATARFRFVLFGDYRTVPGDVNRDGKPLTREELDSFSRGHYRAHAIDAQIRLVELGVWHTPSWMGPDEAEDASDDDDAQD